MPRREDDDVAQGYPPASTAPRRRSLVLAGGFALAVLATLAVFLTDNPQYLRIAVVAVAWAFVLATFAAGRRGTDQVAAAAREAELRSVYERELDREIAARREYELELENAMRRETEDAMRYELDALRGEIAALASLRDEVARVTELRGDLSALGGLRDEIARLAALRDDVASLGALRQDLGQMGELRADLGRMRDDLTQQLNDQLSSEMLVERIVMRTQGSRAEPTSRSVEGTASWIDEPPETRHFHELGRPEPAHPDPWTAAFGVPAAPPVPPTPVPPKPKPAIRRIEAMPTWADESAAFDLFGPAEPYMGRAHEDDPGDRAARPSRHAAEEAPAAPRTQTSAVVPSLPAELPRPSPRPRPFPPSTSARPLPEVPNRRRGTGEAGGAPVTGEQPSGPRPMAAARPAVPPSKVAPPAAPPVAPPTVSTPIAPPSASAGGPPTGSSVAQILAQNGGGPATGSRRRRRYREDDESDDVLARVLREN